MARPLPAAGAESYWEHTRRPLPCLVFLLPFLTAYEWGVAWLGRSAYRTGADLWLRAVLRDLGLTWPWWPPTALVLVLTTWLVLDWRHTLRFRPRCLLGMAVESGVWALVLIGLSRVLDLAFEQVELGHRLLEAAAPALAGRPLAPLIGFLGAGIYEEAVFRLALVPVVYTALKLLQGPEPLAGGLAVAGSALLFALAHHAGATAEPFSWFAFVFRWLAGVYFGWVFVLRGFGIAVGTHAAYDVLVGWFAWQF